MFFRQKSEDLINELTTNYTNIIDDLNSHIDWLESKLQERYGDTEDFDEDYKARIAELTEENNQLNLELEALKKKYTGAKIQLTKLKNKSKPSNKKK